DRGINLKMRRCKGRHELEEEILKTSTMLITPTTSLENYATQSIKANQDLGAVAKSISHPTILLLLRKFKSELMNMENEQNLYCLKKSVEELTTSGRDKLDEEVLKKMKKICKQSDIYIIELYKLVYKALKKKHAEIRFSAFQICEEIFKRSHCFRELLLKDFKQFTNLVLGLDPHNPLPKPQSVAQKLKQRCVKTIQQWYDTYGKGYVTLSLGYKFLRDCKKVDFADLTARTEAQRQRDEEERQRLETIKRKRAEKINTELETVTPEIKTTVLQFQNGFRLLIPDVNNFFISSDIDDDMAGGEFLKDKEGNNECESTEYGSEDMRSHGIMKGINVVIDLDDVRKVKETKDNQIIIENLKENIQLLRAIFLPQVKRWEETIRPYSEGNGLLIKRIINLKNTITKILKVFESLKIETQEKETSEYPAKDSDNVDSDDDDDFIEVPFNDPRVTRAAASEAALLGIKSRLWDEGSGTIEDDPSNKPSTSQAVSQTAESAMDTNIKEKGKILDRCPDGYMSKAQFTPHRHHNPLAGLSQVWQAAPEFHEQDEMEGTGGILGVATQRIHYERTWEPVKWECRAPLASGRLCPRKDREKCPLHGPIIARDELGQPISAEDAAKERAAREEYERNHPVWQDPHLLAEIKASTGVDLKMPKGKSKRKNRYENLTNIKKTTPYDRIAKKVLNKRSLGRINKAYAREHQSSAWGSSNFNFNQT
ncbi:hypothetical protein SK128_016313, partial [Halocaridina rubra]